MYIVYITYTQIDVTYTLCLRYPFPNILHIFYMRIDYIYIDNRLVNIVHMYKQLHNIEQEESSCKRQYVETYQKIIFVYLASFIIK